MTLNPDLNPWRRFSWRWWLALLNIRDWYRQIKWYYQRATRGWADCDVWGMDTYLCDVIIPMLQQLKLARGIPASFFGVDSLFDDVEATTKARAAWHTALDDMIAGFKAIKAVEGGMPERFFSKDSWEKNEGFEAYVRKFDTRFDSDGYKAWKVEQIAISKKGLQLFIDNFHHLWD